MFPSVAVSPGLAEMLFVIAAGIRRRNQANKYINKNML
jgi:hypothetical protein